MKQWLYNQRGMTLVELLAALAVMTIVLLLMGSLSLFGQKQFMSQTNSVEDQANVRHAVSFLTKEIRGAESVSVDDHVLSIDNDNYQLIDGEIVRDSTTVAQSIKTFHVVKSSNEIKINITGASQHDGDGKSLSTVIYLRE
ncbi:PilW family protein [Thalassobacillus sp. CUG 92003]|uniref:PilW family protein n=1 Tax=Thalassobacillus sp. CUG 92003 TaxID=2736641 RepID=UPI0015E79F34|nr:prepilin-type N-terminal cleavage/methylation domain-containing protein [Thalassobacillus sp. CUG 92003]